MSLQRHDLSCCGYCIFENRTSLEQNLIKGQLYPTSKLLKRRPLWCPYPLIVVLTISEHFPFPYCLISDYFDYRSWCPLWQTVLTNAKLFRLPSSYHTPLFSNTIQCLLKLPYGAHFGLFQLQYYPLCRNPYWASFPTASQRREVKEREK